MCVNFIYIYIYIYILRERERESIPFFDLVKLTSLVTEVMKLNYYEGRRARSRCREYRDVERQEEVP